MKSIILPFFTTILFLSFNSHAQFPEGFETSVPPPGWVIYTGANGLGTAQSWQASNISNSGVQSAYVRYENVSGGLAQDWLVTPQFTPTSSTNLLTFMQRQSYTTDYGSVYKVLVSTGSQTVHGDFTLVDTQTESDFTYFYTAKEIDLSAYVGIPIYVAFVMEQDDGDNWLIDDVALTTTASCVAPNNIVLTSVSIDSAGLSWSELGSANSWAIEYGFTGFVQGTGSLTYSSDTSVMLTGLNGSELYDVFVRSICAPGDSSVWTGPFTYLTLSAPIIPDYLNDFSVFPGVNWSEATGAINVGPSGSYSSWESDFYLNTTGDTSAKVNLYFSNSNHWLISPDFDLSGGAYELNLEAGVTEWNLTTSSNMGSDDQVDLLISTDLGVTWNSLYQWNSSNTPSNLGTPLPTIDLSTYTGTVRFAFLASDGIINDPEDYDFFINDFSITAISTPCATAGIDVITACDGYTWIDGVTYTSSNNTATHTLTNSVGCDSIVTLDLTINNSSSGVDIISACDGYTWIDGVTYTSSNNTATHTLTNSVGCDSVVTLNLTINNSSTGVDVVSTCDNYTWIDGVTYTSSNNTATFLLSTISGCDSLITLNLTIDTFVSNTDVISACDSYTWIDGITYTSSNNTATHTLTNVAGCDSIVTLDLTINNSSSGLDAISACDSYTWIDGITYTSSNNTATHTLTNSAGCDSIVTLDLVLNTILTTVTTSGIQLISDEIGCTYQWTVCPNFVPISGEVNQVFEVASNGEYAVILKKYGCIDTSICYAITEVGINEKQEEEFTIYPNPFSDVFQIDLANLRDKASVKIIDFTGKIVFHKVYTEIKYLNIVLDQPKGLYYLVIESDNIISTRKIIKQ